MTTTVLVIDVPAGAWLTANGRYHWAERHNRTRWLRRLSAASACAVRVPKGLPRARVEVYVHGRTRRRVDPANAYPTVKALIDGLIDYGMLPDDDADHLIGPDMRRGAAATDLRAGWHRVTIHITPITTTTEKEDESRAGDRAQVL